jgi:regulator of replication initiation timing
MNDDRAQVAALSTAARAYLVTLETMRAMVEEVTTERDALAAELAEVRATLDRIERRERVQRYRRKRGRA